MKSGEHVDTVEMAGEPHGKLNERVITAAEAVLNRDGSVGVIELLQQMRLLAYVHVENWRKGHVSYPVLEDWIQAGPEKYRKTIRYFEAWAHQRQMKAVEASYTRRSPRGIEQLRFTRDGEPERERLYRTHYAPADAPSSKSARVTQKLNRPPDLVVFQKVGEDGRCSECGETLRSDEMFAMEKSEALCLNCADLDSLVFLPAGDTALTRRARKHSSLSAVVVRFNRARKRYERQGVLVKPEALARAEEECEGDAHERAAARNRAAIMRQADDKEFVDALVLFIKTRYPGCPAGEARKLAEHTALRGSGRVGRSAAGRALDAKAIELAVVAHIRHAHTEYDRLLMDGTARMDARAQVRGKIEAVLGTWSEDGGSSSKGNQGP